MGGVGRDVGPLPGREAGLLLKLTGEIGVVGVTKVGLNLPAQLFDIYTLTERVSFQKFRVEQANQSADGAVGRILYLVKGLLSGQKAIFKKEEVVSVSPLGHLVMELPGPHQKNASRCKVRLLWSVQKRPMPART